MRPLITATLLATLALGTTSCGNDTPSTAAPPTSTPTSPTATNPSPTATPTVEPWEKHTEAGAMAFARHWIDLFNQSRDSGDIAPLEASSTTDCVVCKAFAERTAGIYQAGGKVVSRGWQVEKIIAAPGDPEILSISIRQPPSLIQEKEGGTTKRFPTGLATYTARLTWVNTGWKMSSFEYVS